MFLSLFYRGEEVGIHIAIAIVLTLDGVDRFGLLLFLAHGKKIPFPDSLIVLRRYCGIRHGFSRCVSGTPPAQLPPLLMHSDGTGCSS